MNGTYEIVMGNDTVGQARVSRSGLYYHFACRCKLSGDVICRVVLSCGDRHENLGILVPKGEWFVLDKKIPAKRLLNESPEFRVLPRHHKTNANFIPVYPDEPFRYLARLQNAFLDILDGKTGVVIQDAKGI